MAITESRQNCQLNIDLEYPSGFQYSVFSQVYRGYVELDADVTGTQGASYYFSGRMYPRFLLCKSLKMNRNCNNIYLNILDWPD